MITSLVAIILALLVLALVLFVIDALPVPPRLKTIMVVVAGVIFLLWVIQDLLRFDLGLR